jgi:hypothetical protein
MNTTISIQPIYLTPVITVLSQLTNIIGKPGPILIDTSVYGHHIGTYKTQTIDIVAIGSENEPVTIEQVLEMFKKLENAKVHTKDTYAGTYIFDGLARKNSMFKIMWGT